MASEFMAPEHAPEPIEQLPERHPWEEPPRDGWSSSLRELGLNVLALLSSAAAAVALVRIVVLARRLGEHPSTGLWHALIIALWAVACVLASALAVYIARRVPSLSILLAMLTDYGRLARLGGRPPVWLDAPPKGALRIAHLSDLHVAESERVRLVEHAKPAGNAQLARVLESPELADADLILFTGDITDRGSAVSWRRFLDLLDERGLSDRAVLVPGNHDLAYVDRIDLKGGQRAWKYDRFGVVALANLLKFADAFGETGGGARGFVLGDDGQPVAYRQAWETVEREVRPFIASLPKTEVPAQTLRNYRARRAEIAAYRGRIERARARLLALFPIAVPTPEHDAVIFVLNSCVGICRHPATNALGLVGRAQYKRLERLSLAYPQKLKLVAVHHHVVRRAEEMSADFVARLFAKFTVLSDSRPLVRFCRLRGVRAVMNGHRHLSYQLRLPNGTVLLAAPSSTLGDELAHDPRPQFERYDFAESLDGPTVGIYRRVVRPVGVAPAAVPLAAHAKGTLAGGG